MSATQKLGRQLVPPRGEDLHVVQGVIRSFDQATFDNTVEFDGLLVANVPVASGVEALTYQPGDVVLLEGWFPGGKRGELGIGSYWIRGRVITPGTGAAESTVAFLRGTLAKEISAEVFAARVHQNEVVGDGGTASATYTEVLTGGNGPSVSGVEVSAAGIALVGVQAQISIIASPSQTNQAYISYRVTGATSRPAVDSNAKRTDIGDTDPASITNVTDQSMSWSIQTGLTPGEHSFETMYRVETAFASQAFSQRRIIVIAL